jgi:hypothetical protein
MSINEIINQSTPVGNEQWIGDEVVRINATQRSTQEVFRLAATAVERHWKVVFVGVGHMRDQEKQFITAFSEEYVRLED